MSRNGRAAIIERSGSRRTTDSRGSFASNLFRAQSQRWCLERTYLPMLRLQYPSLESTRQRDNINPHLCDNMHTLYANHIRTERMVWERITCLSLHSLPSQTSSPSRLLVMVVDDPQLTHATEQLIRTLHLLLPRDSHIDHRACASTHPLIRSSAPTSPHHGHQKPSRHPGRQLTLCAIQTGAIRYGALSLLSSRSTDIRNPLLTAL